MRRHITFVLGPLLFLVLAACASGAGPDVATAGGEKTSGSAAALSGPELARKLAECMRANGAPDFPDPKIDENGEMEVSWPDGADPKAMEQAHEKCKEYSPDEGEPEKMDPENLKKVQAYATCMRENGVSKFPDPDSSGRFRGGDLDLDSAETKAAHEKCKQHMPGGGGFVVGGGK
jgi:hypothetical protein